MTDNEIKKALECCEKLNHNAWSENMKICKEECPYKANCYDEEKNINMITDALDLINRQQAEIERLNGAIKNFKATKERQKAEINRLNKAVYNYEACLESIEKIKAKAIKEFADRLEKMIFPYGMVNGGNYGINALSIKILIDKVRKEMVGEE